MIGGIGGGPPDYLSFGCSVVFIIVLQNKTKQNTRT
jgi:hypothetical protein